MLTKQQNKILRLHSAGYTPEEIGDKLTISPLTVRKHIQGVKEEVHYNKASELAGYGICEFLGIDYKDLREKMIASILALVFLLAASPDDRVRSRKFQLRRRYETETYYQTA